MQTEQNKTKNKKNLDDIEYFLKQDIRNLSPEDKIRFYNALKKVINFAISKAYSKLSAPALERQDYEHIGWLAFEESLEIYHTKGKRKTYISFLIDSIYWKCMDMSIKFLTNKHRVVNVAYSGLFDKDEFHDQNINIDEEFSLRSTIEWYFKNKNTNEIDKQIFDLYIYGEKKQDITAILGISRNKMMNSLNKTLRELKEVVLGVDVI
ncbi:hypothetical protein [Mesoplasma photuris]|uniref:hypothetical protein n=1 Tax=Mesoplasma photuris TaxID=217731 RepID=UPI0004E18CD8|nr:hypothetical protein [Mesoplasma photuris]